MASHEHRAQLGFLLGVLSLLLLRFTGHVNASVPTPVPWSAINETCSNDTVLTQDSSACFASLPVASPALSFRVNTSSMDSSYLIIEMSRENVTVDAFRLAGRVELTVQDVARNLTLATDNWGYLAGLPYVYVVLNKTQFGNRTLNVAVQGNYSSVLTSEPQSITIQGPIRLRFADSLNQTCALGPFSESPCWGNGTCSTRGICDCSGSLVGPYCSVEAPNITVGESTTTLVNFSTLSYYRFSAQTLNTSSGATNYAVTLAIQGQNGCPELLVTPDNGSYRSMPVFATFSPNDNFPANESDTNSFICGYSTQNVLLSPNASTYWVSVANRYCPTNMDPFSKANVTLQVKICGGSSGSCPPASPACTGPPFYNSWFFLLPILFGGIAGVLGIGLLLAWLFPRREYPTDPGVLYAMGPYVSEAEAQRLANSGIRIVPLRGQRGARNRLPPIPPEKIEAVFPASLYCSGEHQSCKRSDTSDDAAAGENAAATPGVPLGGERTPDAINDNTTPYMMMPNSAESLTSPSLLVQARELAKSTTDLAAVPRLPPESAMVDPERSIAYSSITCPVCLEDFADGDRVRRVGCHHLFHTDCIDPWLRKHPACPVCREDFSPLLRNHALPNEPRLPDPVAQPGDVERGIGEALSPSGTMMNAPVAPATQAHEASTGATTYRRWPWPRSAWLVSRRTSQSLPSSTHTESSNATDSTQPQLR